MGTRRDETDPAGRSGPRPAGRIAAIDFGTVRMGIALSDADRTIAGPWETYARRTPKLDAEKFQRLAADEAITLWVIGLPVHLDGRESRKSLEARQFGQWLQQSTGLPVVFFDERFTTAEAEDLLRQAELTGKRRKNRVDMLAAHILLTAYLESHTGGQEPPRAIDD
ncbi:MAG: Holliday junction resolvase RuvX [Thermoguttaceae bacterium]|jgi:putative Holliday junction resolvase